MSMTVIYGNQRRKFNNVYRADNFTPNFGYTFQRVHFILKE